MERSSLTPWGILEQSGQPHNNTNIGVVTCVFIDLPVLLNPRTSLWPFTWPLCVLTVSSPVTPAPSHGAREICASDSYYRHGTTIYVQDYFVK
jgi:hypothetical protein